MRQTFKPGCLPAPSKAGSAKTFFSLPTGVDDLAPELFDVGELTLLATPDFLINPLLEDFGSALWLCVTGNFGTGTGAEAGRVWFGNEGLLIFEETGAAVTGLLVTMLRGLASDEPMRSPNEISNADVTARNTNLEHLGTPIVRKF